MKANVAKVYIVMGVSGSGKSSIGQALAERLGIAFIDGDDLHPSDNIKKMCRGEPLNDKDRQPWLNRIRQQARQCLAEQHSVVIVCSALKKHYRDTLRQAGHEVVFIFLDGSFQLISQRLAGRSEHFMPSELLASQFASLEVPSTTETDVLRTDINGSVRQIVSRCISAIARSEQAHQPLPRA
ncbi:gluconokinase [Agarivorans sp. MS3-6]|uniref:gluconokinase n=1 Tax=Agarivorans sp. TSD2052 TaxID=2937286 RepID=UPI00200EF459|nr:gluconokinase [Agarivorans sp. TSD2052]UPW17675.1 gluconokinase [Agarivorans sp. TSD2052]